jgi:hypothetical protein
MTNILLPAGEEIVETHHLMTLLEKSVAEVGAQEAGAASNKNTHDSSFHDPGRFCRALAGRPGAGIIPT